MYVRSFTRLSVVVLPSYLMLCFTSSYICSAFTFNVKAHARTASRCSLGLEAASGRACQGAL